MDNKFSMDYMGASEFEFGTLPKVLARMREHLEAFEIKRIKLPTGEVAWALSVPEDYEEVKAFFQQELEEPNRLLKMPSLLRLSYEEVKPYSEIIGWWAIDESVGAYPDREYVTPWVMFKKKSMAKDFLKGLKAKPTENN
ncbi:MAG: hypothetical protein OEY01_03445 [Desulfobulbaceae bacterium]|nr:hypothetical protein [Desulfobulbaceae bacterium]